MGISFTIMIKCTVSFPFSHNPASFLYAVILIYIACPQPTPKSGFVMPIIQISQRNNLITFKCKDGYWPNEEFSTICLQNGTWTMDPNDICTGWNVRSGYKGVHGIFVVEVHSL